MWLITNALSRAPLSILGSPVGVCDRCTTWLSGAAAERVAPVSRTSHVEVRHLPLYAFPIAAGRSGPVPG